MELGEYIREFTVRDIIRVRNPKVVVIGGGTGLSTILRGLKEYTNHLTAIVTMGDDGGSSGRLRDDLGVLPPGDIRNCILALADDESVMTELFNYRFEQGELGGHSFGNLFLAAMDGISTDFYQAIKRTSDVLHIKGNVLPVSLSPMILVAELEDETTVEGESKIPHEAQKRKTGIETLHLKDVEKVQALDDTLEAIREANIIVLGPGSLYTSIIPNLLVPGITEAIGLSNAQVYYMGNIMTQPGETDGYNQEDHIKAFKHHASDLELNGIIQHNGKIPEKVRNYYLRNGQKPVEPLVEYDGVELITDNLISIKDGKTIRHNADKAARLLFEHYIGRKS